MAELTDEERRALCTYVVNAMHDPYFTESVKSAKLVPLIVRLGEFLAPDYHLDIMEKARIREEFNLEPHVRLHRWTHDTHKKVHFNAKCLDDLQRKYAKDPGQKRVIGWLTGYLGWFGTPRGGTAVDPKNTEEAICAIFPWYEVPCGIDWGTFHKFSFSFAEDAPPRFPGLCGDGAGHFGTQKADGMRLLNFLRPWNKMKYEVWPQVRSPSIPLPLFARPCPVSPRHGFVDSRKVSTWEEFVEVVKETLVVEPLAEVIAMPEIRAKWSGVMTEDAIALGASNDGATGGRSVSIPCYNEYGVKSPLWDSCMPTLPSWAQCAEDETYFFELVGQSDYSWKGQPCVVQMRKGPRVGGEKSYAPKDMKVREWVEPGSDLLEWERRAAELPDDVGVWVRGGSLSSHASVHAVINKRAVWCGVDEPPKFVKKANDKALKLGARGRRKLKKMLGEEIPSSHIIGQQEVGLAIAALHASPLWGDEEHLLKLRARAIVLLVRALFCACMGEARHFTRKGPGRSALEDPKDPPGAFSHSLGSIHVIGDCYSECDEEDCDECGVLTRDKVYDEGFYASWHQIGFFLRDLPEVFEGNWRDGYGGKKWEDGARRTQNLWAAVRMFMFDPSEGNYAFLMEKWNEGVDAAHNGGKLLDKFGSEYFPYAQQVPGVALATEYVWNLVREYVPGEHIES